MTDIEFRQRLIRFVKWQKDNHLFEEEDDKVAIPYEIVDSYLEITSIESNLRKLSRGNKSLMTIEAGYIYCMRNEKADMLSMDKDQFADKFIDMYLFDDFGDDSEIDKICKDLRAYRRISGYELKEITQVEYELCVDRFGEQHKR